MIKDQEDSSRSTMSDYIVEVEKGVRANRPKIIHDICDEVEIGHDRATSSSIYTSHILCSSMICMTTNTF